MLSCSHTIGWPSTLPSTALTLYSFQSFFPHFLLFFGVYHGLVLPGVGLATELVRIPVVFDVALFLTPRHLTDGRVWVGRKELYHPIKNLTCHL